MNFVECVGMRWIPKQCRLFTSNEERASSRVSGFWEDWLERLLNRCSNKAALPFSLRRKRGEKVRVVKRWVIAVLVMLKGFVGWPDPWPM